MTLPPEDDDQETITVSCGETVLTVGVVRPPNDPGRSSWVGLAGPAAGLLVLVAVLVRYCGGGAAPRSAPAP